VLLVLVLLLVWPVGVGTVPAAVEVVGLLLRLGRGPTAVPRAVASPNLLQAAVAQLLWLGQQAG
jgi:hypothetical protein